MITDAQRAAIRRHYRLLRAAAEKTQLQVQASARPRLDEGRYWKIENGFVFPTDVERGAIARVLKVNPADLPGEQLVAKAS